jgi:hypothetical protein
MFNIQEAAVHYTKNYKLRLIVNTNKMSVTINP